jgi:hypothetical protein
MAAGGLVEAAAEGSAGRMGAKMASTLGGVAIATACNPPDIRKLSGQGPCCRSLSSSSCAGMRLSRSSNDVGSLRRYFYSAPGCHMLFLKVSPDAPAGTTCTVASMWGKVVTLETAARLPQAACAKWLESFNSAAGVERDQTSEEVLQQCSTKV